MSGITFGVWDGKLLDGSAESGLAGLEGLTEFSPGVPVRAIMGWAGFLVFDDQVDLVDMARAYLELVQAESCGKCVPCRMGTRVAADALGRIADGRGTEDDLDMLRGLGDLIKAGSMCELGHTSMNAVLAMLDHFEDDFRRAITEGKRRPRQQYHKMVSTPCIEACPERLDIPRYIENIRSGRYTDSLSVIREKNPLASVCGRVCVRFCEIACRRGKLDDPIDIMHLKRFVADVEMDAAVKKLDYAVDIAPDAPRVAIVGAGPAGMTAAYHLLLKGYQVDVFEAMGEAGGMAAVGIPDYRLPRAVLRIELDVIAGMGARVHYNSVLGRDFTIRQLKEQGFQAVFLAIGAQRGSKLRVEGEDDMPEGYELGIDFLRAVNSDESVTVGHKVVVVGGGNVAMDCARSALRLGDGEVHLVYRRDREAMPADPLEVDDCEDEGVHYHFLCNPTRLLMEEGRVAGVECLRMELGELDASGRRRPVPIEGSEFVLPCDMIIPAIGQQVDATCLDADTAIRLTRWRTIQVDEDTLLTDEDGVFAGGDCSAGPATLIEAMAAGFRVSHSIDQYIREGRVSLTEEERMSRVFRGLSALGADVVDRHGRSERREAPMRSVSERITDFEEVGAGLSPEDALLEADRCLRCYRILLVATDEEPTPVGAPTETPATTSAGLH